MGISMQGEGDDEPKAPPVKIRIIKGVKYDKFLISLADKLIDESGERRIDNDGVKEFFDCVEHPLRPSALELRTLRYIFQKYPFTDKAKKDMEERCGLGPDPIIWDAVVCYFSFVFVVVGV